jgi:uncharacterized protein YndB with AHSA1/START domain/DNA-binding transcriptional ArsR family regulator
MSMDQVFRALGDPSRRRLLDGLFARNGQTLSELCEPLAMTRQAVTKHLGQLEAASLVVPLRRGREKRHYLNPVPIHEIAARWIGKFERDRLDALAELKRHLEGRAMPQTFVYVTYIRTTPEKLWDALTDPAFTRRYWSGCWPDSTWAVGSPWRLMTPDGRLADRGEVLECARPSRLVVSWHNELFAWARAAGVTRATFTLESMGEVVKLTITHEVPEGGAMMLGALSKGWPMILSSLKSLLETGEALPGTDRWPETAPG